MNDKSDSDVKRLRTMFEEMLNSVIAAKTETGRPFNLNSERLVNLSIVKEPITFVEWDPKLQRLAIFHKNGFKKSL